jgi:hypothetical protein
MSAPQPRRNIRAQRQEHARRLRYRSQGTWGESANPESLGTAYAMTAIGVIGVGGFALALFLGGDGNKFATPLLLIGASMLLFGSLTLLLAGIEWAFKRLIRSKKYCGRCVFYQSHNEEYDVGLCRADPREGFVQRTHSCPYFRYSERAMVRDRLAQRPELLKAIKIVRVESDEQ